jgi:DNA-binding PadR family transcriptional regulator
VARPSQTDLAVLAVLNVQPMTGYAVREAIREELGHFWSESFGQIYPTISALANAGLVQKSAGERPGSSTWSLTDRGRERLLELLRTPDAPVPPRNGLMLRLFFGNALGADECTRLVAAARATAVARLEVLDGIEREMATATDYPEHRPYWALTVSAGRHTALAAIAWADEALAALEGFPRPASATGAERED